MSDKNEKVFLNALLYSFMALLGLSAIRPHDYFTWIMEVFPALIALALLVCTYKRFKLTGLAYGLIWLHALILIRGGHYTYAQEPFFNWLRDAMSLDRNYYDRLGHFAQGFVPAIITREMLLRTSPLKQGKWLFFLTLCVCLSISACYELLEWRVSVATGSAADDFLGTQGDIWDSQWDMATCLIGAVTSLLLLGRTHDRQIAVLQNENAAA